MAETDISGIFIFHALIEIKPDYSHSETADLLGKAFTTQFEIDDSGNWEEYPAFCAYFIGIELALLAPPDPEYDVREKPDDTFQLCIKNFGPHSEEAVYVNLSEHLISLIRDNTNLQCTELQ